MTAIKITKKRKFIVIVAIFMTVAGVLSVVLLKKPKAPILQPKIEQVPAPTIKRITPDTSDHLKISKLGINAKITSVGVTKEGNMDVPSNIYDVGWYNKGAKPGSTGTAVLAGHLNGTRGQAGVFANLDKLSTGDIIKIVAPNGKETSFIVSKTKVYSSTDKPTEIFTSISGTHLNLITCTGSWDKNKSQFDKRLVIFTDLVK